MVAPANDLFANAEVVNIAVAGGTFTRGPIDSTDATTEAGEDAASTHIRSIWYKYTPVTSGTVTFDTVGSFPVGGVLGQNTDTEITVTLGPTVSGTPIAADSDSGSAHGGATWTSWLQFAAVGGTTYWLRVGSWNTAPPLNYVVHITGPNTAPPGVQNVGRTALVQIKYADGTWHPLDLIGT
jgi:hypothetical protein